MTTKILKWYDWLAILIIVELILFGTGAIYIENKCNYDRELPLWENIEWNITVNPNYTYNNTLRDTNNDGWWDSYDYVYNKEATKK